MDALRMPRIPLCNSDVGGCSQVSGGVGTTLYQHTEKQIKTGQSSVSNFRRKLLSVGQPTLSLAGMQGQAMIKRRADSCLKLAKCRSDKGDLKGAEGIIRRGIADMIPDEPVSLWAQLALIFAKQGRNKASLKATQRAVFRVQEGSLVTNKERANVYNSLAAAYERLGDYENSILQCEKALMLDPSLTGILFHIGNMYSVMKKFDEAGKAYRRFMNCYEAGNMPHTKIDDSSLARVCAAVGSFTYQKMAEHQPSFCELQPFISEQEEAVSWMVKAIQLDPYNRGYKEELQEMLSLLDQTKQWLAHHKFKIHGK